MRKPSVIIIGAGIAGLAAAQTLIAEGIQVKVLEARSRYGGRIWVDHSLGVPLGKGATWVHGFKHNPLNQLAKKYEIPILPFKMDKFVKYGLDKKIINATLDESYSKEFSAAVDKSKKFAKKSANDIPLSEALAPFILEKDLLNESVLFQNQIKFFENYVGAEYEFLSAKNWNEDPMEGEQGILQDAYEKIIFNLSFNVPIELNTVVSTINSHPKQVEVITSKGKFTADWVLLTVPLGVIKNQQIQFNPPLSQEKQNAIHRLDMGLFNIVAMKFPKTFWPEEAHAFSLPDSPLCSMFLNAHRYTQLPILLGYFGGIKGRALETENDEILLEKTMAHLRYFFGKRVSNLENYFITRWHQDPFSRGSYSYLPVHASSLDRHCLSATENKRLFFAGEATNKEHPATVQGAYVSGIREANKIKKRV